MKSSHWQELSCMLPAAGRNLRIAVRRVDLTSCGNASGLFSLHFFAIRHPGLHHLCEWAMFNFALLDAALLLPT
jgi:hypothetical protein